MAIEPLFPTEVAGYLGNLFKKLGNIDGLKNDFELENTIWK